MIYHGLERVNFARDPGRPPLREILAIPTNREKDVVAFRVLFLLFESYTFAKICDLRCTMKQNFHPRQSKLPTDRRRYIATSAQGCYASYRTFCKPPTFNQAYCQGARSTLEMVPGRFLWISCHVKIIIAQPNWEIL